LSRSVVIREEEVLHKYQDKLEETDLEENTRLYECKGLLGGGGDRDEDDSDEETKSRPLTGKEFGVIDWGEDDEEEEDDNYTDFKTAPAKQLEETKTVSATAD
jgi:hypothetical protein